MTKLSAQSLDWCMEHFSRYCDTNVFPMAFEYNALHHCWDSVKQWLIKQDINQWCTRPFRRCLVPKHRYGFRLVTQLDPLDTLIYLALVYEIGEDLEKKRIPSSEDVVFSSRFAPDSSTYLFFDSDVNFLSFQERSRELASEYPFVLLTDIADFYPRIYLHRLENVLSSCARTLPGHAKAIIHLIKSWNQNVSYGIPVGSEASSLLAELVIEDIDRSLLSEDIVYCRYVDDYRMFCASRQEAYQRLAYLANLSYNTHGFTLQSGKTRILSSEDFVTTVLETPERREIAKLAESFEEIVEYLGLDNPYEPIDYDSLSDDVRRQIDGLNLGALLDQQLDSEEIDLSMTKFLLNRLGQTRQIEPLRRALKETDKLYPVFAEVIRYIANLTEVLSERQRGRIGAFMLKLLSDSVVSHLPYHRMLILSLFAGSNEWGNADKLAKLHSQVTDDWSKRCVVIALGMSGQDFWFRARKAAWQQFAPWERRAFLVAASCLPKDERKHWYRAIRSRLDVLEKFTVEWAKEGQFGT